MKTLVPHYYKDFHCIADKCRESCCIGWEIDIDSHTLEKYRHTDGIMGDKLKANITVSEDGSDCFRLAENERCPFLNEHNLCELIIYGGDDMLCDICRIHPRFYNEYTDICEYGIGLCCEEAARIILTDERALSLEVIDGNDDECTDETDMFLIKSRELIWKMIDNGTSVGEITADLLAWGNYIEDFIEIGYETFSPPKPDKLHRPDENLSEALSLIRSFEPLNNRWKEVCGKLTENDTYEYYEDELTGYKNLLKYYIYRYYADLSYEGMISAAFGMAVFSADAVTYIKKSTGMSFADSACLWSKETEYSEENKEMIYDYSDSFISSFLYE